MTIVLPTLNGKGKLFRECVEAMLANTPAQIFIVTPQVNVRCLELEFQHFKIITILGTQWANKRLQLVEGLRKVRTAITVFADDDVLWPPGYLHYLLAAFEDDKCGAAGSCQRLAWPEHPNLWHFLGSVYLERRNFEFSATVCLNLLLAEQCLTSDRCISMVVPRLSPGARKLIVRSFCRMRNSFAHSLTRSGWACCLLVLLMTTTSSPGSWSTTAGKYEFSSVRKRNCKPCSLITRTS